MTPYVPPYEWKAYLDCQCGSKSHLIVLEYHAEMGMGLSVQARQWRGFWTRLWVAIKYVFAGKTLDWDGTMLQVDDIDRVQEWLNQVKVHGPGTDYAPRPIKMLDPE